MLSALILAAAMGGAKTNGWVVFYDQGASIADFKAHADRLDTIGIEWLECAPDGTLQRAPDVDIAQFQVVRDLAHGHGVTILGMLQNHGFDPAPVELNLKDPAKIRSHAKAIVDWVVRDGLDGLDLDYESLKQSDRSSFSDLVDQLSHQLHAKNKLLAIALHAKTSEPGDWDGPQAQDWSRIGRAVDRARVMCYDEHWETSEAGPLADPSWVRSVMTFAATEVPKGKLEIGVPGYGYDWIGKKGDDITFQQFMALPGAGRAKRDPVSQELVLQHGNSTAYFCDSTAEACKITLARELGLRGVCLWRMGSEDPGWWALFK